MKSPNSEARSPKWWVIACAVGLAVSAFAQGYSVDWSKIAGGGSTSTGGTYQVSGTIGQPDASGPMTGGNFALTGGFWSLYSVIQTEGAPLLGITRSNNFAILFWSSPATGYGLEQTLALSGSSWNSVTNVPADSGTIRSVTLPVQPGNKFFRLKKQ
jgi:hypothetical protein